MFEQFFDSPIRVQALRDGPGGPLLEGFVEELYQAGYAEITARRHIRAAEHLIYWTDREGIPLSNLTEKFLERFDCHLDRCQCLRYGHTHRSDLLNGARLFLKHLRGSGVITVSIGESTDQDPVLLTAFCQWMHQQRGTCDRTLYNYSLSIRDLLKRLGEDPSRFDAQSLRQFVLEKSQQCGWASAKKCTTALRMFLCFLMAEASVKLIWVQPFRFLLIGAFPLCQGTCNRKKWSVLSLPVIQARRSVSEIVQFYFYLRAWDFGQVISLRFVWVISIGKEQKSTYLEKDVTKLGCL